MIRENLWKKKFNYGLLSAACPLRFIIVRHSAFGEISNFGDEFRQYDNRLGRSTIKFAHLCVIRGFCVNLQFIIHWNIKYIVYEDCKS